MRGDTVTVEYVLHNRTASTEKLDIFTVDVPTTEPTAIASPEPSEAWSARINYRNRPVARWAALRSIAQGSSSPPLSFQARGLPGIAKAWYQGDKLPTLGEDDSDHPEPDPDVPVPAPTPNPDPLIDLSVETQTVGVDAIAAEATAASLTARLDSLTAQSCALGWITQASLCTTLRGHLTAQPARLAAFRSDVAAGHTVGGPVTDNAYWLLIVNADYLQSLNPPLDIAGIRLTYICGNKFRVRNPNGTAVPVSWDVYNKNEAGTLTLPPKVTGQPYSESFFTTVNKGTVRLFHTGQLIQTKANGGAVCPP